MACLAIVRRFVGVRKYVVLIASAAMATVGVLSVARAQVSAAIPDEATSWHEKTAIDVEASAEHWIGGEGYRHVASLYSGITWAPFTNLRQDGLRLRAISGQSLYTYAGGDYRGTGRFLDVLTGWQFSGGGTTIKAFGGATLTSNLIAPFDPSTQIQGNARSPKGVLEIWHNWTPRQWTSIDLSFARSHATATGQIRHGIRLDNPAWSIGAEAHLIAYSDTNYTVRAETLISRAGLFVRFETVGYEFTVSGGVSQSSTVSAGHLPTTTPPMGYATAQYLRRF